MTAAWGSRFAAAGFAVVALLATASDQMAPRVIATGSRPPAQSGIGSDELQSLEPCATPPPPIPADWQRIESSDFTFALPQCFQRDAGKPPGVHGGGQRWICGKSTVEIVWGMWGLNSFSAPGDICRADVRGIRVMRKYSAANGSPQALTWYLTKGPHQPIIAAYADGPDGSTLVQQIANSGSLMEK